VQDAERFLIYTSFMNDAERVCRELLSVRWQESVEELVTELHAGSSRAADKLRALDTKIESTAAAASGIVTQIERTRAMLEHSDAQAREREAQRRWAERLEQTKRAQALRQSQASMQAQITGINASGVRRPCG
jgi:hypothetical protein